MTHAFLNKSDYQRFVTCPVSAYYAWQGLPSNRDDDPFLSFLADEGNLVGAAARRLFREGIEIKERGLELATSATLSCIHKADTPVFEGCARWGNFIARPDVLIRQGNRLFLIEVKSKSGDMRAHLDGRMLINIYRDIRACWREYVHDLAFQTIVASKAFPEYEIVPYFLMPESNAIGKPEEIEAVRALDFSSEDLSDVEMRKRRSESILKFFPAQRAINQVREQTEAQMLEMESIWLSGEKPAPRLRYQCKNCEFRLAEGNTPGDGWHQCWGSLAEPKPHVYHLNQLYSLKQNGRGQQLLADQKIQEGKTSLFDITVDELHGEHATRQTIQLEHQRAGTEWIAPELGDAIAELEWPICFLDFETSMSALPWYPGMKPYQLMPFQFSAHVLHSDGSWQHREWLNTEDINPTLNFIEELRNALVGCGSILTYTDYENRILSEASQYLLQNVAGSESERAWISELMGSGRIIDQHDWVHRWYFHPAMNGRTSIKVVLPAIWSANPSLHKHEYFKRYHHEQDELVLNPYKTLPTSKINGVDFEVREGCAAMSIYREMIRGIGSTDTEAKRKMADLLRSYVTLDTASQWLIFEHWCQRIAKSNSDTSPIACSVPSRLSLPN
ncbi:MAG: DUF2779 domain-containing protein [Opitutales bacterium]